MEIKINRSTSVRKMPWYLQRDLSFGQPGPVTRVVSFPQFAEVARLEELSSGSARAASNICFK